LLTQNAKNNRSKKLIFATTIFTNIKQHKMSKQKNQYTFRVIGSHLQFMEVAFSENEAKRAVAESLLVKEGIDPNAPDFSAKVEECMDARLKLVQVR